MSALGQKQTLALHQPMSALGQKRTFERHLPAAGGQAVRDIKPTLIAASGDAHLGAVSPDALLVPGELMAEHAPSRQGSLRQPGFAQAVFVSGEIFRTTER